MKRQAHRNSCREGHQFALSIRLLRLPVMFSMPSVKVRATCSSAQLRVGRSVAGPGRLRVRSGSSMCAHQHSTRMLLGLRKQSSDGINAEVLSVFCALQTEFGGQARYVEM